MCLLGALDISETPQTGNEKRTFDDFFTFPEMPAELTDEEVTRSAQEYCSRWAGLWWDVASARFDVAIRAGMLGRQAPEFQKAVAEVRAVFDRNRVRRM
jgi:hypothetical protein